MGKYIHIGNAEFISVRKDEYVDKSMLIKYVNSVLGTQRKFMCVTRARRFGKSIAAKMLNAYYDESVDSRALFTDLAIAKDQSFEANLNKYPVIYLDVTKFSSKPSLHENEVLPVMDKTLMEEIRINYPKVIFAQNDDLSDMLLSVVEHTHKQFFMIIDEWDAICREVKDAELVRQYVDWLRSLFKTSFSDRIFAGVYMTGILPIKQYNTQSALNNFEEFSMINPGPLAGYFGFTVDEVHALCEKYDMDETLIKQWYDGYQLGNMHEIFNPYAVMRAMQRRSVEVYWTATGAYEGLLRYITMNFDGLRDAVIELLVGAPVKVNVLGFSNDMHDINSRYAVLTLLIHLGYLSYDRTTQTACIPNYEVRSEFERAIQDTNWKFIAQAIQNSDQLLHDTLAGNEDVVAKAIELVHQDNTSILQYNDENALAYVISLAYQAAHKDYLFVREMPAGKGFADMVLVPRRNVDKPAIVLELKYNQTAETAISQIKERRYIDALRDYIGEVILVGMSYDKNKGHSCKIERISYKCGDKYGDKSTRCGDKHGDKRNIILAYLANHPHSKTQQIAEILHVGESQTKAYLKDLVVKGFILSHGANKNRTYTLK